MEEVQQLDEQAQMGVEEEDNVIFFKKKKRNLNSTTRSKDKQLAVDETETANQEDHTTTEDEKELTPTIEEVIALRRLRQNKVGIELDRLNAGEPKKKKKRKKDLNGDQSTLDGLPSTTGILKASDPDGDLQKDDRLAEDEPEDEEARTRKIIKSNHFTQQTNTLDVDKHMMAYIEEELQRRRKDAIAAGTVESSEPILKGLDAIASLDPRDELYKIAEKYRINKKPVVEGNVTLSATMLTSIPEVDLGIDNRIRNFEATEKAKRQLTEQRAAHQNNHSGHGSSTKPVADTKEHFAADRFLLPNHMKPNPFGADLDSLKIARLEKEGLFEEAEALRRELKRKAYQLKYGNSHHQSGSNHHRYHGARSNQVATDDRAVENFRKRMGGRR